MRACLLLALATLAATATGQAVSRGAAAAAPDESMLRHTAIGTGVTFAQPSFAPIPNATAHQQDMVVEHAGWQYAAWWNQDRFVEIARRRRFAPTFETLVLRDHVLAGEDAHDTVNIGVCPRDGTIHLAFDHHVDTLRYRVSVPGLASTPEAFPWQPSLFGTIRSTLDPARGTVTRVTYPRFFATPDGDLQMAYREYTSGNGRIRFVDYDGGTGTWSGDRVVIERTGSHSDPLGGTSTARNPYFNTIEYDDQGVLHATWTWRERASTAYNRDIAYAYSPDGGVTWFNGGHAQIADTSRGQAITAASPGVNAISLGAEWGLMNNQAQVVDDRGRVHVVMYHKDAPDTRVSYGSRSNSHYNHYWKDADGVWRSSRLPTIGNRPKMFAGDDGTLFLAYVLNGALTIDRATAQAHYLDWSTIRSYPGRFGTSAQGSCVPSPVGTLLTIAVQRNPATAGTASELGLVDLGFLPIPERPRAPLFPIEDAYVRAGSFAATNFGRSDRLIVKHNGGADFEREAFVKFDVSSLRGMPVRRVLLEGTMRAIGAEGRTTPYFVHPVGDDSWTESGITWNSRPVTGPGITAHFGRPELRWDVTATAMAEATGDGTLSLALISARDGADRILHLHARESTNVAARLRLVVEL